MAKETSSKLRQCIRRFRPKRDMKNILLLHDNSRPQTNLRNREAFAKMELIFLSLSAHSPDLASSDCHLFVPINDVEVITQLTTY
jgi:hypothetical protein